MSAAAPERVEPETISLEQYEFDVCCDMATLCKEDSGYPQCPGNPAKWVAWRQRACGHGPAYRLICDDCRKHYLIGAARGAWYECRVCGRETGPFIAYTPLKG